MSTKVADLAGPGIGNYEELEKVLPSNYESLLTPRKTQEAIHAVKAYIEENMCRELDLMMVTPPLIVDVDSGVNDYLDRDGSRTPIEFHMRPRPRRTRSTPRSCRRRPSGSAWR